MPDVNYYPLIQAEPGIGYVDMRSTTLTAHKGDWLFFSGGSALSLSGARTSLGYHAMSGIGIALDDNPRWTNQGSAVALSAMPVGKAGVFRVTGHSAYTAGVWLMPTDAGSGRIGQTGRTGKGAIWSAANAPNFFTAIGAGNVTGSATLNSAVARVLRRVTTGGTDGVSAQLDIEIFPNLFGLSQT